MFFHGANATLSIRLRCLFVYDGSTHQTEQTNPIDFSPLRWFVGRAAFRMSGHELAAGGLEKAYRRSAAIPKGEIFKGGIICSSIYRLPRKIIYGFAKRLFA